MSQKCEGCENTSAKETLFGNWICPACAAFLRKKTTPTLSEMIDKVLDVEEKARHVRDRQHPDDCNSSFYAGYISGARAVGEPLAEALREAVEALARYNNGGVWHRDTTILNANTALEDIRSILEKSVGDA